MARRGALVLASAACVLLASSSLVASYYRGGRPFSLLQISQSEISGKGSR